MKSIFYWFLLAIPTLAAAHDDNDLRFFSHVNVMTGELADRVGTVTYLSDGRVEKIEAPLGENNTVIPIAQFSYFPFLTEVRDIDGALIRYYHEEGRLQKVEYYDEKGQISTTQEFDWEVAPLTRHILLSRRTLFDAKHRPLALKLFCYDDLENIIEDEGFESLPPDDVAVQADECDGWERCGAIYSDRVPVQIELPIARLTASNEPSVIHCKGMIGQASADWVVECGFWDKLQISADEKESGVIHLMRHLPELLPHEQRLIGLITFQNGIKTSFPQFMESCLSIAKKIPEGTLLIALHNKTKGLALDLVRVIEELSLGETAIVTETREFMGTLAQEIDSLNPKLLWGHIVHSEGGAIAKRAIEKMTADERDLLKKHLYLFSLGSVLPIPDNYAFSTMNVYSKLDYFRITGYLMGVGGYHLLHHHFGKHCNIQFIPSTSKWYERDLYLFDHAFLGGTYGLALDDQIKQWRERYCLYDGKKN